MLIGIILLVFSYRSPSKTSNSKPMFRIFRGNTPKRIEFYILTGFATLWTIVLSGVLITEYISLSNALVENRYAIVEGVVTQFDPMPYTGRKDESFTVNGIKFKYSDYLVTNAFNNTKSHGGPIDEGKYVKIYYYDGKILRLWVKE
ncbi:MAG: hypothetical protein PHG36_07110 [Dehalococcoidia bacterium]|nr:hypothetical protein [Dehalococcoidia bacterium]